MPSVAGTVPFNVGDKLRVARNASKKWPGYHADLDKYIGKDGVVVEATREWSRLRFPNGNSWAWTNDCFERPAEEVAVREEAERIIRDAMLWRAMMWWHGKRDPKHAESYLRMGEARLAKMQEAGDV